MILTDVCNVYAIVDETCGTDVFSKVNYLVKVILSCMKELRLSLAAVQALCLVLTLFDL